MSTSAIMNLGADQMANQFVVSFPGGIPGGGNKDAVSMRVMGAFTIPNITYDTYDIDYRGLKVTQVSTKEATDKSFPLELRLDQQWEVFDGLKTWLDMVFDPETHIGLPTDAIRTTAIIQAYGRNDEIVKTISFKGVVIKSLQVSAFDPGSSEPSIVTAEFAFFNMFFE